MNYLFFLSELVSLSCTIKNPLNVTRHIVTRHVLSTGDWYLSHRLIVYSYKWRLSFMLQFHKSPKKQKNYSRKHIKMLNITLFISESM